MESGRAENADDKGGWIRSSARVPSERPLPVLRHGSRDKIPQLFTLKVNAFVGPVSSVVTLRLNVDISVAKLVTKVLQRFPEDKEQYCVFIKNMEDPLDEEKPLKFYAAALEEQNFCISVKSQANVADKKKAGMSIFRRKKSIADMRPLLGNTKNIFEAAKLGNKEEIAAFIRQDGKEVLSMRDEDGQTPLHLACFYGHFDLVSLLLKSKADTHVADRHKWTPLHCTFVGSGNFKICELLLKEGADPLAETDDKNVTLHYLVRCWDESLAPKVVSIIMKKGQDINCQNASGETALHKAAFAGNAECVKLLIKSYKADVNRPNRHGETPLHYAARKGFEEIVQLLLDNGADSTVRGEHGTPKTVSKMFDHAEIAELLKRQKEQEDEKGASNVSRSLFSFSKEDTLGETQSALKSKLEDHEMIQSKLEEVQRKLQEVNAQRVKAEDELFSKVKELAFLKNSLADPKSKENTQEFGDGQMNAVEKKRIEEMANQLKEDVEKVKNQIQSASTSKKAMEGVLEQASTELSQSKAQIEKLRANLRRFQIAGMDSDIRVELHHFLAKELNGIINTSRDWNAAFVYTSAELEEAMNLPSLPEDEEEYQVQAVQWHKKKLKEIQKNLHPSEEEVNFVSEHRRFVKSGAMKIYRSTPCRMILLNDIMIVTTSTEDTDQLLVAVIPIDQCTVRPGEGQPGLEVLRKDIQQKISFGLDTVEDQEKWITHINGCISTIPGGISTVQGSSGSGGASIDFKRPALSKDKSKLKLPFMSKPKDSTKAKKENLTSALKGIESNEPTLTKLVLTKCNLKPKGAQLLAAALKLNNTITHLQLSENAMGDKGIGFLCAILKDNTNISSLWVDGNPFTMEGMKCIISLLQVNICIKELNLAKTTIGNDTAIIFAQELAVNNSLKIVNLNNNNIGDLSAPSFAGAIVMNHILSELHLQGNAELSVTGESQISDAIQQAYSSSLVSVTLKTTVFMKDINAKLKSNQERIERSNLTYFFKAIEAAKVQMETQTKVLDVGFYKVPHILSHIPNAESLVEIYLDHSSLIEVPDLSALKLLKKLVLLQNSLTTLPASLFEVASLVHLDISGNEIKRIPGEIKKLSQLEALHAGSNDIYSIPEEISQLPSLKTLFLHKNRIFYVPTQLFALSSVTQLTLDGNPMPLSLQKICHAWVNRETKLDLSSLGLECLPAELGFLKDLQHLNLSNNKLRYLPPQIGLLDNLKHLNISNNRIQQLPCQIAELKNLEKIEAARNERLTVLDDMQALRTSLSQQKEIMEPFAKAKLMIVGRDNVGKTSLRHCLLAKNVRDLIKMKKERGVNKSTDGIDIEGWSPEDEKGKNPISFNIWDFGGQDIYYITHQFFINSLSIYLVVFNLKDRGEEISRVDYWLQSIHARSPDSAVVLVGTHADECTKHELEDISESMMSRYIEKFKNIKHFVSVSCKTRTGFSTLQQILVELAEAQKEFTQDYSIGYHQLQNFLQEQRSIRRPPVVRMAEFATWVKQCGINEDSNSVACLFNDLGIIVYFNDAQSGLNDLVILYPQWLTKLMSTLITTKPNFVKNGILLGSNFDQIWKAPDYPEALHPLLLNLLEKFEISFPLPPGEGKEQRNLIPALAQGEEPSNLAEYHSGSLVKRSYTFKFLPFGFFSRLVVRALHFMEHIRYWKNGILMGLPEARCQMEYFAMENLLELSLICSGKKRTECLRLMAETVNVLLRGWYKVEYSIRIPCNCQRCTRYLGRSQKTFFTLNECEMAASQGQAALVCNSKTPSVSTLNVELPPELQKPITIALANVAPDLIMADMDELKIPYEELEMQGVLGRGAFGEVFKAMYKGEAVAVKKLEDCPTAEENMEVFQAFRREVWLCSIMDHPTIVSFKGFCLKPICMVIEFIGGGDLKNYLKEGAYGMTWKMSIQMAINIADAVAFLHRQNPKIIHRDLKSPNVLMVSQKETDEIICKVTDFGESLAVATKAVGREKLANPAWCAPEIMKGSPYTEKADVFGLGMVMWEIVSKSLPYSEYDVSRSRFMATFEDAIINGLRPTIPPSCHRGYANIIRNTWKEDPDARPSAQGVLDALLYIQKTG